MEYNRWPRKKTAELKEGARRAFPQYVRSAVRERKVKKIQLLLVLGYDRAAEEPTNLLIWVNNPLAMN